MNNNLLMWIQAEKYENSFFKNALIVLISKLLSNFTGLHIFIYFHKNYL